MEILVAILKKYTLLIAFVLVFACDNSTIDSNSIITKGDEEKLIHLKKVQWPQAYREQDTVLLNSLLAKEFQMIDAKGNWSNKAQEMDYITKNKPWYNKFNFEIKRLDLFENGTAVVAGTGYMEGTDEEGAFMITYQSSNILIKRAGQWKAISSHVSGINKEAITDN